MPRAFLAIHLPIAVRSTFAACREDFCAADPAWQGEKWVAEENLHVTLRFLGTVEESAVPLVLRGAAEAVRHLDSYRLRLDVVRAVPRARSASLLWVAPSTGGEETVALAERLTEAVSFLDYEPQGHAFKPHVTLCRARRPRRADSRGLDAVERILRTSDERSVCVSVREVTLFSSKLTPRGPVYEELGVVAFGR